MKKESTVAIILGIVFGIIIAIGIIMYQTSKNTQPNIIKAGITPTININNTDLPLTVSKPNDLTITNNATIKIEGQSKKGSLIIIQSPGNQLVDKLKTDRFNFNFDLSPGENIIKISVYNQPLINNKTIKIYYLKNE